MKVFKCLLILWAKQESHFNFHFLDYEEAEYFFVYCSSSTSWIVQVICGLVMKGFQFCSFHACSQTWWVTLTLDWFWVPNLFHSFLLWFFILGKVLTCIQMNFSLSTLFVPLKLRKPLYTSTFRSFEVKK